MTSPEDLDTCWWSALSGQAVDCPQFKSRCERLGWQSGIAAEGARVFAYLRTLPVARVQALLEVDNCALGANIGPVRRGRLGFRGLEGRSAPPVYQVEERWLMRLRDVPAVLLSEVLTEARGLTA